MADHGPAAVSGHVRPAKEARLRKHGDYQRVYRDSRKHFSGSMSYFYALRTADPVASAAVAHSPGPRVGLTAGKVLGKAVERNRIKRRMREAVRRHITVLTADVDVILHPRKTVAEMEYSKLESEVARIFAVIDAATKKDAATRRPAPANVSSGRPAAVQATT